MVLNLVLLCDGVARLALLALHRRPVGSLFGILLRPLTEWLLRK